MYATRSRSMWVFRHGDQTPHSNPSLSTITSRVNNSKFCPASRHPCIDLSKRPQVPSSSLLGSSFGRRIQSFLFMSQCGCARVMSRNIKTWDSSALVLGDMTMLTRNRRASYGGVAEKVCVGSPRSKVVRPLVSATHSRHLTLG